MVFELFNRTAHSRTKDVPAAFKMATADGMEVPFAGASVSASLAGVLAHTRITQHFINRGRDQPIEVLYTFPLPAEAVLLGMTVRIGERTLNGIIKPRAKAEASYETEIGKGNAVFLLKRLTDAFCQISLGNLMPDERIAVTFHYAEILEWSNGRLRYRLPTVIPPHYGDHQAIGLGDEDAPQTDPLISYSLDASITIEGELQKCEISSPTHRLSIQSGNDSTKAVLSEPAHLDRDLILDLRSDTPPVAEAFYACDASKTDVLAALVVPDLGGSRRVVSDLTVVLDCSGSMAGDSMEQARKALVEIVRLMPNEGSLQIVRFGDYAETLWQEPVRLDDTIRQEVLEQIRAIDADLGGTKIVDGIELALESAQPGTELLLITDGNSYVREQKIAEIAQKGHRIFCVGVGSAVSEDLLNRISTQTNGSVELVTPNEQMRERIVAHFRRMTTPPADAAIYSDGQPIDSASSRRVLYSGDTVAFALAVDGTPRNIEIQLATTTGKKSFSTLPCLVSPELATALPRVCAWLRLKWLPETEAKRLAVEHQLLTKHTAMIAVLERAESEKPQTLPNQVVVPNMMAAGWGGFGGVAWGRPAALYRMSSLRMSVFDLMSERTEAPLKANPARTLNDFFNLSPSLEKSIHDAVVAFAAQDYSTAEALLTVEFGYPRTRHSLRRRLLALLIDFYEFTAQSRKATYFRRMHRKEFPNSPPVPEFACPIVSNGAIEVELRDGQIFLAGRGSFADPERVADLIKGGVSATILMTQVAQMDSGTAQNLIRWAEHRHTRDLEKPMCINTRPFVEEALRLSDNESWLTFSNTCDV